MTDIEDILSARGAILRTASDLISGERAETYGNFKDQMTAIAGAFNAITGREGHLEPRDVGLLLQLLKLRRMQTSKDHDGPVDLCGYTALYAEAFL